MVYDVIDFQEDVIQRSFQIPVVVDFWANWCGPCKVLGPVLERLASQNEGKWELAKVNTEELQDVAMAFRIQSIPAVKLFFGGKIVGEFVGALPEPAIKQWLEKFLPGQYQNALEAVKTLLLEERVEEAQSLLEEILAEESGNVEAKVLLAKTYIFTSPQKALALIEGIDDPKFSELTDTVKIFTRYFELADNTELLEKTITKPAYCAAIQKLRSQDFEGALGAFIEIIRNDRMYDEDGSRKACIAIFKYLGEEHPTTLSHRRDFSNALY